MLEAAGLKLILEGQEVEQRQPSIAVEVGPWVAQVEEVLEGKEVELGQESVQAHIDPTRAELAGGSAHVETPVLEVLRIHPAFDGARVLKGRTRMLDGDLERIPTPTQLGRCPT